MSDLETARYLPHPMGVKCSDCGCGGYDGEPLRHSSWCDVLPKGTEVARLGAPVGSPATVSDAPKSTPAAAYDRIKHGVATADDHEQVATGSLRGLVSWSDAMNQDC